jgi:hypothetical protein
MTTPHKSTRSAAEAAVKTEILDTFIPLYTKNVERAAELGKKSLDVVAAQNSEWMEAWKKAFHFVPDMPGMFLFDVFGQTMERLVETQKGAIDLAVEQSHAVAELAQERGGSASKMTEGVASLMQQTVEQTVAAQKKALDYVAEQQKTAYETAKKQFRISGNPAAEAFQTGMDTLIETQKAMLDIASKPLRRAAAA